MAETGTEGSAAALDRNLQTAVSALNAPERPDVCSCGLAAGYSGNYHSVAACLQEAKKRTMDMQAQVRKLMQLRKDDAVTAAAAAEKIQKRLGAIVICYGQGLRA